MRIGIEAQRLLRKNKHGIDIVALNLLRNLTEADGRNEYVLFTRNGEDAACLTTLNNIRVVILPAFTYADWEQIQLPLAVRREKIDLLHCTSSTAPLFVSVPTVLTLHDTISFERPLFGEPGQTLYQRLGNAYRTVISRFAVMRASKVITVSEFEKERIISRYPELKKNVVAIHNGVDAHAFSAINEKKIRSVRNKYSLPRNYFLHFGNSDPKKNTDFVIRSYAEYASSAKRIFPLVITDMPRHSVLRMLEHCSALHLAGQIITPGYVEHNDLPALYAPAMALLFPSKRESFGLPVLEAMAADVPVIVLRSSSLPEIAGDAAFYLEEESTKELSQTMRFIQENMHAVIDIVRKGRTRAERFQWKNTARSYADQYSTFRHFTIDARRPSLRYTMQPTF